ncbi:hypothetical protein Phi19:3_gp017 [Cellulophaga phage phi19:3]|uniref:Uncharacterized protein n=1 Tax=Cellulophaga phage phi19:3 TaxID=1327971 RepID=R9ZWE6_9CAUD|nr:hypothetical protein Phi19:3_gp017 [Cellulophaga phage phi19:3]AGO47421.1 hypothetical protein Phi19:3_gp017 [Cellulophaga phage phi19:3]
MTTPQEMITEEIDYYESIGEDSPNGFVSYVTYVVCILLISLLFLK